MASKGPIVRKVPMRSVRMRKYPRKAQLEGDDSCGKTSTAPTRTRTKLSLAAADCFSRAREEWVAIAPVDPQPIGEHNDDAALLGIYGHFRVLRYGAVNPLPTFHSRREIWPIGLTALCDYTLDPGLEETYKCEILEEKVGTPTFRITDVASRTVCEASTVKGAWAAMVERRRRAHLRESTTSGAAAQLDWLKSGRQGAAVDSMAAESMVPTPIMTGVDPIAEESVGGDNDDDAEERELRLSVQGFLVRKIELQAALSEAGPASGTEIEGLSSTVRTVAGGAGTLVAVPRAVPCEERRGNGMLFDDANGGLKRALEGMDGAHLCSAYHFTEQRNHATLERCERRRRAIKRRRSGYNGGRSQRQRKQEEAKQRERRVLQLQEAHREKESRKRVREEKRQERKKQRREEVEQRRKAREADHAKRGEGRKREKELKEKHREVRTPSGAVRRPSSVNYIFGSFYYTCCRPAFWGFACTR